MGAELRSFRFQRGPARHKISAAQDAILNGLKHSGIFGRERREIFEGHIARPDAIRFKVLEAERGAKSAKETSGVA